jgi:hypothetical protein
LFSGVSVYIFEENASPTLNQIGGPQNHASEKKESFVKSNILIAFALLAFAGLAVPARSQQAEVVATVPFDFVVVTTTLPAGTYTVSRTSSPNASALLVANRDHGVLLLPTAFDSTKVGNTNLSFEQIGGKDVLSQIKTLEGTYTLDNSREAQRLTKMAQSNDHNRADGMTSSGGQ